MSFFQRYRDVGICIMALVIPFFFLKANLKESGELNAVDEVIVKISYPVQYAATAAAEAVGSVWTDYIYLVNLNEDNDRLIFEVQRLQAENNLYLETSQEVRRLRKMLGFRDTFEGEMIAARVVSWGISEQFRVINVKHEGDEKFEKGMPVVTFNGLVGQITTDVDGYASVMLTVDRKSQVPVVVHRNGAQGILRGTGETERYTCNVEYLLRSDEVREGDQLFTSGTGGKFPEGILAGRIVSVQRENLGLFQKVVVEPAVHFSRLKEVFVITKPPQKQKKKRGRKKSRE